MRTMRPWLAALMVSGLLGMAPWQAAAQSPGINPGRDCQTLLTCQYSKGGVYRGCLSSYSCRVCRLVPAGPCGMGPGARVCHRMVCTWG
jgi:hypothetical protein